VLELNAGTSKRIGLQVWDDSTISIK
jgi:hypothetical protein